MLTLSQRARRRVVLVEESIALLEGGELIGDEVRAGRTELQYRTLGCGAGLIVIGRDSTFTNEPLFQSLKHGTYQCGGVSNFLHQKPDV